MNTPDMHQLGNATAPTSLNATDSQLLQSSLRTRAHTLGNDADGESSTPTLSALLQALRRRWLRRRSTAGRSDFS